MNSREASLPGGCRPRLGRVRASRLSNVTTSDGCASCGWFQLARLWAPCPELFHGRRRTPGARKVAERGVVTRPAEHSGTRSSRARRAVSDEAPTPRLDARASLERAASNRGAHPSIMAEAKRFAMVCAANMNRSMEAHKVALNAGLDVKSYGAGNRVKLPGASRDNPNVFEFGSVTYKDIYDKLMAEDEKLYTRNGLKDMLERNMTIKPAPQRWQDSEVDVDVVVCFEERVFDNVVSDLKGRVGGSGEPLLVINLDVVDSHEEALNAGPHALKLCEMIDASDDWECECDEIMDKFAAEVGRKPIYTVCFH